MHLNKGPSWHYLDITGEEQLNGKIPLTIWMVGAVHINLHDSKRNWYERQAKRHRKQVAVSHITEE